MEKKAEKYLLLYLKTGGGHLAPAKSIASQLKEENPNIEPVLIDGFERSFFLLRLIIEGGYRKLQNKTKWFYEFLYAINKIRPMAHILASIVSFYVKPYMRYIIKKENPSKIIIFHFFLVKPVYSVLSEMKRDIKVITVVTDPFTAHPLWFLNKKQNFIVFSTQLKNHCITMGIKESSLHVFPFILDKKFSVPVSDQEKNFLKDKYSVPSGSNIILILGGGDGIPKGKKITELLLKNLENSTLILVAGKNKNLMRKAETIKEDGGYNNLRIFGYVDFIYELINISDIVVTKCGASTFMEILISKKIPVITDYIWEQEKGNKDYIVQNGMGIFVKNLNDLPAAVKLVLSNRSFYLKNIINAHLKNGTEEVSRYISNF
jgi:UDP-N-acetylglucosamine:LPS N-acetylglucosamine transferase